MTSREKISSNRSSQTYSLESPRNPASRPSWRCTSPKTVAVVRTYKVKRSGALQVLSMATDWSPPLVTKTNQLSFAWCRRHGANRMAHPPQKVVTSGVACNTISRKWRPTSVSQPPKPFDGSTSASVSLRSVEPSCKSSFEDQLPNLIDTVRNSWVERSETLLLLSVAMEWNFYL